MLVTYQEALEPIRSHWYLSEVNGTYQESLVTYQEALEPIRSHWYLSGVTGTY